MNEKLTLQELIDALAARHQMEPHDADAFVKAFWALIEEGLMSDNYVKIKGLGTFKLIETEARESINIQTGERIEIQSHARITFTPDASLRDQINRPFAHFETVILNDSTQFDEWDGKEDDTEVEKSSDKPTEVIDGEKIADQNLENDSTTESVEEPETPVVAIPISIPEEQPLEEQSAVDESAKSVTANQPSIEEEVPYEDVTCIGPSTEVFAPEVESQEEQLSHETPMAKTEVESQEEQTSLEEQPVQEKVISQELEESIELEQNKSAGEQALVEESVQADEEQPAQSVHVETTNDEKEKSAVAASSDPNVLLQEYKAENKSLKKIIGGLVIGVFLVGILVGGGISLCFFNQHESSLVNADTLTQPTDDKKTSAVPAVEKDSIGLVTEETDVLNNEADTIVSALEEEIAVTPVEEETVLPVDTMVEDSVKAKKAVESSVNPAKEVHSDAEVPTNIKKEHPQEKNSSSSVPYLSEDVTYLIVGTIESHTIRRGDTLTKLARKYYGNKKIWPYIVKHNQKIIKNPNNVPIGTTLRIPKLVPQEV